MLTTYFKRLKKNWAIGIIPPAIVVLVIPIIAMIWPELKDQAEAFAAILESDFYKAFLGDLAEGMFTTWQGMIMMYVFIWIDIIMIFMAIFMPVRLITSEVDKGTLDVTLSYPIPRWKYLLEKYSVYLSYQLLYPVVVGTAMILFSELIGEPINVAAIYLALGGVWLKFFALGSLTFLCAALFLNTNRSMAVAALVVLGSFIGERLSKLVASAGGSATDIGNFVADFSIFNYLTAGNIQSWVTEPLGDLIMNILPGFLVLSGVGIGALLLTLFVFEGRELVY
jgi:ABC-type transport system involved in multi-copper enzyme maturation permease subunit